MKNLQKLKENYENHEMKTIVVSQKNYDKLGKLGHFGDLRFEQLSELQNKRYYKDGPNLKDRDGVVVSYRDGKIHENAPAKAAITITERR